MKLTAELKLTAEMKLTAAIQLSNYLSIDLSTGLSISHLSIYLPICIFVVF